MWTTLWFETVKNYLDFLARYNQIMVLCASDVTISNETAGSRCNPKLTELDFSDQNVAHVFGVFGVASVLKRQNRSSSRWESI